MAKETKQKASPIVIGDVSIKETPVIRAIPKTQPFVAPTTNINVRRGWYLLVKVDANGNEIAGTDVQVSNRDYERTFKHRHDYAVKKSPNQ